MIDFKTENLTFSYPNENSCALKNIDLEIHQGEFAVICGKSGSGKSTLLRMLKPELTPKGEKTGEIAFFGKNCDDFSVRESAEKIGFVLQNTEYQAVTHTVRSELVFGLENIGLDTHTMRLRIAEICAYFSLEDIIDKKISELSGGQKQLVCLASVVAMRPKAIILDEPTSQLDPVSATEFLNAVERLCRENGMTVIISEHRLENVIPLADRVVVIENGEKICDCKPREISQKLLCENEFMSVSMPVAMRLFAQLKLECDMPLSVNEGHKMLAELLENKLKYTIPERVEKENPKDIAIEMKAVKYAYDNSRYILKNMSLSVKVGAFVALMGANGAGKTTALSIMSGLLPCQNGKIKIFGKRIEKYKNGELYNGVVGVLPQKCESLFAGATVREDLQNVLFGSGLKKSEISDKVNEVACFTEIEELLDRHPYDISGGELQRAALAAILLKEPKIIFLDEPTKAIDNVFKEKLAKKIKELCHGGVTVVMVSHDTEFCAEYCDECAMIFDGECIVCENKYDFFSKNYFYTTSANKISRDVFPTAVTQRQVLDLCQKNLQN